MTSALTEVKLKKMLDALETSIVNKWTENSELVSARLDEVHKMLRNVLVKQDSFEQTMNPEKKLDVPAKKGGRKAAPKKAAPKKAAPTKKGTKKATDEAIDEATDEDVEVDGEVDVEVDGDEDVEVDGEVLAELEQEQEIDVEIEEDTKHKKTNAKKTTPPKDKTSPKKEVKKNSKKESDEVEKTEQEVDNEVEEETKSKKSTANKKPNKPPKKEKEMNKMSFFNYVCENDLDTFNDLLTPEVDEMLKKKNKAKLNSVSDEEEKTQIMRNLRYQWLKDNHDEELINAKDEFLKKNALANLKFAEHEDMDS